MVLNSGTGITDHIDMLDKMLEVITSRALTAVAVNAGGTGHAIGDIIQITATGATSTIVCELEVYSVSGGVIDGIRVYRGGAYTVDPTTIVANPQSASSGSGISATFDLTFSAAKWSVNRRSQEGLSAVFAAAGTGYTVGDQLTVTLATGVQEFDSADAVFNVDSISGGGGTGPVLAVSIVSGSEGLYGEVPPNPVSVTGGTGSSCTLTVTWQDPPQTRQDNQVCMIEGEGLSGTDAIHVIIKPYAEVAGVNTAYNWQLLGATGYNALLAIQSQTGIDATQLTSLGDIPTTDKGSYFVLKDNDADPDISWWLHTTGRRIILVCKVESAATTYYTSMYVGFLNQLATETEYPYPLWICGTTSDRNRTWFDSSELMGGIVEVIAFSAGDPQGPGYLREPDGLWVSYTAEGSGTGAQRNVESEWGIYPFMASTQLSGSSQTVSISSDVDWTGGAHDIIPSTGVPGTENILLKPTPGTGDDYYWLVAPIVVDQEAGKFLTSGYHAWGEIDGVFWFHRGNNAIVSEDRFVLSEKRYLIFANGNRTQNWSYFALNED